MRTIKGPAIFLAQFAGEEAPDPTSGEHQHDDSPVNGKKPPRYT